ncbi:MAG: hypothetical protein ACLRXQ_00955 [Phascolarctobacterium faecium]
MAMHIYDLGWMLAQVLLLLCSAPLVAGIIKKVKSLLQNRIGSSIFQEYFDLYKWWQKYHACHLVYCCAAGIFCQCSGSGDAA